MGGLAREVIELVKGHGAEFVDAPLDRVSDKASDELPPAIAQFVYRVKWPEGQTFTVPDPEDEEEELMWMVDWSTEPLELLTEDHGPHFKGNLLRCGIYDGGNYILALDLNDRSDDPWVYSFDHYIPDDEEFYADKRRLSDLLRSMKPE